MFTGYTQGSQTRSLRENHDYGSNILDSGRHLSEPYSTRQNHGSGRGGNAGHRPAMLSMKLVDLEGREVARAQKQLVSGGSWQEWEVGGLFGVPPFKGVWVVQSDLPLGIAAERRRRTYAAK